MQHATDTGATSNVHNATEDVQHATDTDATCNGQLEHATEDVQHATNNVQHVPDADATCNAQRATWGTVNRYHCDIKIENALVAKDLLSGTFAVKLCDFTRLCHSVRPSLPPPHT